ncbi:MAG: monovalent cation/H(+) antiporter subunit G [Thermosphaera sp.]
MIDALLFYLGVALTVIGGVLDIIAAIGFFKFKDFYTRLHAATIGAIGGGFYPLIGLALVALGLDVDLQVKLSFAGVSLISAAIIAVGVPSGTHVLARSSYKSGEAKPVVVEDKLERKEVVGK